MWQSGFIFNLEGRVISVDYWREHPVELLKIGKLPNPYKPDDPMSNTVKNLQAWKLHAFLLAWSTLNSLDNDHMAALLISQSVPQQHQTDMLAKNLVTLFCHKGPEPMTKEMFINVEP